MTTEKRTVVILPPTDEPEWETYVEAHCEATIYHTLAWRDILYKEYRFQPLYLMAKEGSRIVGILPLFLIKNMHGRRLVSLPFSIYGGPLGDTKGAITSLLNGAIDLMNETKARCVEIRPMLPLDRADAAGFQPLAWGEGTITDLTRGTDSLWKGMTERFNVKKGAKKGLTFSVEGGERLADFYRLQLMTRKRQGLPAPRIAYYAAFFSHMPGRVKLAMVEKGGEVIAADMFFLFKERVLLVLNASDRRYANYKANDFMIWHIIKWCCEAGFSSVDHGPIPVADRGLMHFKKKWGGSNVPVARYYYPDAPPLIKGEAGSILIRAMPLRMAALVGSKVLRLFA